MFYHDVYINCLYQLAFFKSNWDKKPLDQKKYDELLYGLSFQLKLFEDSFDADVVKVKLEKNLSQYVDKKILAKINPITFVNNNQLSFESQQVFSGYEYIGDKLYDAIIIALKLDALIDCNKAIDYKSASFQEKLCEGFNVKDIIQSNGLKYISQEEYSPADYFEAFLANLYEVSKNDFNLVKDFVYSLINQQASRYLLNESEINEKEELYERYSKLPNKLSLSVSSNLPMLCYREIKFDAEEAANLSVNLIWKFIDLIGNVNFSLEHKANIKFFSSINNSDKSFWLDIKDESIYYSNFDLFKTNFWSESQRNTWCLEMYSIYKTDLVSFFKKVKELKEFKNE